MALTPLRRGDTEAPRLDLAARPAMPAGMPGMDLSPMTREAGFTLALSDRIDRLVQRRMDAQDSATRAAAADAGTMAGEAAPGTLMQGGGDLYQAAFNRAAIESGARRLEISARTSLADLARKHEADPGGFASAAQQYRDGLLAELPPQMRPAVAQGFDTLALPLANAAREAQQRQVAQQNIATFNQAMPARLATIQQLAMRATRDPAAATALQQEQAGVIDDLVAMGPPGAFSFAGRDFPADPTRAGALTLPDMVRQLQSLQNSATEARVIGEWRAAGGGAAWIDDWQRNQTGSAPRGIRNNNPLNIVDGDFARGQPGYAGGDGRFARFDDPAQGLAAADALLRSYAARGLTTPQAIIARWAPRGDGANDPDAYAATVARKLGIAPNAPLDMGDAAVRQKLALAMAEVENGRPVGAAAPAGGTAMPLDQVERITRTLRSLSAAEEAAQREAQQRSWADLAPVLQANQAAVQLTGQEPTQVSDEQLRAAGRTDAQIRAYRDSIAFGQELFTAQATLATGGPDDLAAMRARAMPGGDLFERDPRGAVQLAHRIDEQLRGRAATRMEARIQDLEALAAATQPGGADTPRLTVAEGAAAGLTPDRVAAVNDRLDAIQRQARTVRAVATASPAELAATTAALDPAAGPEDRAAENARALAAVNQALEQRKRGVETSPGDHVLAHSAPIRAAWDAAMQDPARILPAIATTLAVQERMGVPPANRQPVPPTVAKALVEQLAALPTPAERIGRLAGMLGAMPDDTSRRQTMAALREAGLPEGTAIGAGILERVGPFQASRVASELAVDTRGLGLTPAQVNAVRTDTSGVWLDGARLGALRQAQAEATGNADFLARGDAERATLEHLVKVRAAAAGGSSSTSMTREAYGHLFGGAQVVNEEGLRLTVPAGVRVDTLRLGLEDRLTSMLAGQPAALAATLRRGTWVDGGSGYVFYPRGSPSPLMRDNQVVVVTAEEAVAEALAPSIRAAPQRRGLVNVLPTPNVRTAAPSPPP